MRLEEFMEDGTLVIRAELASINPDKNVEISIEEGMLHIGAGRREERRQKSVTTFVKNCTTTGLVVLLLRG